jgi:adenosylhomocysteinase
MDMSFSDQALAVEWLVDRAGTLEAGVYDVPTEVDADVANLKLESMGRAIDSLSAEQERYLASFEQGT